MDADHTELIIHLAEEGQRPLAEPYLSLPATKSSADELRLPRRPLCELETVPMLNRPTDRNKSLDGVRGPSLGFVKVSAAAAMNVNRKPGWYVVEIEVVKKLKREKAA